MNPYLAVIVGYSVLLAALGLESLRRTRSTSDFLVAGRNLSAPALFVSLLAANIGAGSTVGAAGLGYKVGLSAWWWVGSAGIGSMILGLTIGPKLWALAHRHNFYTVGDFLQHRFGHVVRYQVAAIIWFSSLVILASQLMAIAWILNIVAGISKPVGCLIGGALATAYFTAGGLKGTIRINAVQLCVKLTGFLASLWYAYHFLGGWAGILPKLSPTLVPGANAQQYVSVWGGGVEEILGYLVVLVPAFIFSPGLLQKIYGARDEQAVRWGVVGNALVLVSYAIVPVLIGIMARAQHPGLPSPEAEKALPVVMTEVLPVWLGAITLAAVFSAEVGTVDAVLLMLSSSMAQDLYRPLWRPTADEAHLLRVSRVAAVVAGCLGIWLALQLTSIIQGLKIFYSLISSALTVPLLAGLYFPGVGGRAAALSIVASVGTTITLFYLTHEKGYWIFPPVLIGIAMGATVSILGALVEKRN